MFAERVPEVSIRVEDIVVGSDIQEMPDPVCGAQKGSWCKVLVNKELQKEGSLRSTRHIEVEINDSWSYKTVRHI